MADYLSRHPSVYEGSVAKAEELFNDWFTVNVVKEISPKFKRLADTREPIRTREITKVEQKLKSEVLTVHKRMQTITASRQSANSSENAQMPEQKKLANSKISQVHVRATVENDRLIQKVTSLGQNRNSAVIVHLPPHGGKSLIPFRSTQMAFYTWITASLFRGICVKTYSAQFISATREGTLR